MAQHVFKFLNKMKTLRFRFMAETTCVRTWCFCLISTDDALQSSFLFIIKKRKVVIFLISQPYVNIPIEQCQFSKGEKYCGEGNSLSSSCSNLDCLG